VGNQYTYQGNKHFSNTSNVKAVAQTVSTAIGNQEIGKSPIEYTNQLSRAKIIDMKNIKAGDNVRSYMNLYQDSVCLTREHERQRYGSPKGLEKTRTRGRATFAVNSQAAQAHAMQQQ
jgi:hypothetical protein